MLSAAALILFSSLFSLPNLEGHAEPLFPGHSAATVLLFVRSDCPNTNRYAPEIARLFGLFRAKVSFVLVYSDAAQSPEVIRNHIRTYRLPGIVVRDNEGRAAQWAQATVTPEAAVFDRQGELKYHGRIDDRFVSLGVSRPNGPVHHDLENAIGAVLAGRPPEPSRTTAVGCSLADLR